MARSSAEVAAWLRRRGRYVLHQLDVTVVARLGSDFLEGILR